MQSQFLSPVKDGRQVLGEKPANACLLSPARNNRSVGATGTVTSPVKRSLFTSSENFSPSPTKKLLPSPSFAGQKRTIDQVEEPINSDGLRVQETRSAGEDAVSVSLGRMAGFKGEGFMLMLIYGVVTVARGFGPSYIYTTGATDLAN